MASTVELSRCYLLPPRCPLRPGGPPVFMLSSRPGWNIRDHLNGTATFGVGAQAPCSAAPNWFHCISELLHEELASPHLQDSFPAVSVTFARIRRICFY